MTVKETAPSHAGAKVPSSQCTESAKLEQAIKANLRGLGYGG